MHGDPHTHSGDRAGDAVTESRHETERLRAALAEREEAMRTMRERFDRDLLQARRELAQARGEQEVLAERLSALQAAPPARAPTNSTGRGKRKPLRPWRALLSRSDRPMEREIALLHQSDLFDAEWYLAEYPDVANTGTDPAEHYLLHGAAEGRNPGPEFNTHQYLFDHPDLVDGGENPLLHFLKTGGAVRRQ